MKSMRVLSWILVAVLLLAVTFSFGTALHGLITGERSLNYFDWAFLIAMPTAFITGTIAGIREWGASLRVVGRSALYSLAAVCYGAIVCGLLSAPFLWLVILNVVCGIVVGLYSANNDH